MRPQWLISAQVGTLSEIAALQIVIMICMHQRDFFYEGDDLEKMRQVIAGVGQSNAAATTWIMRGPRRLRLATVRPTDNPRRGRGVRATQPTVFPLSLPRTVLDFTQVVAVTFVVRAVEPRTITDSALV